MKTNGLLLLCFLLTAPGIYAIIAWSLADVSNTSRDIGAMEAVYRSYFPGFTGSMKSLIMILIALCIISLLIVIKLGAPLPKGKRIARALAGILSLGTAAILAFALM